MIIKKLILTSFGKFENKEINLNKEINIIYGENEAGKTTIHKFIEGMLFGFFKPYVKIRRYTESYKRYLPWYSSIYQGIIEYESEGNIYKIERNFLKGKEEVKIFDCNTGEDITYMFEYNKVTRLHEPSSLHLRINSVIYNNTLSVKQNGNKTDKYLAKEINDKLINIGGSLDQDISIKNVLLKLDEQIDTIGTETRIKTSPYGKLIQEIKVLDEEKNKSIKILNQIKQLQDLLNKKKNEVQILRQKKKNIDSKLDVIEDDTSDKYLQSKQLLVELENLKKQAEIIEKYSKIKLNNYENIIRFEEKIRDIKENIQRNNKIKEDILKKIENLNLDETNRRSHIKSKRRNVNKKQNMTLVDGILIIISLVSTFYGYFIENDIFMGSSIVIFLLLVTRLIFFKRDKSNYNRQNRLAERFTARDILNGQLEDSNELLYELKKQLNKHYKSIESILNENGVNNIEEFKKATEMKKKYDKIVMEIEYKEKALDKILRGKSIKSLENDIQNLNIYEMKNLKDIDKSKLKLEQNEIYNDILNEEKEISRLEERIKALEKTRPIQEIEEELINKNKKKHMYECKLKSIKMAKDTIEALSKDIQRDFIPKLNQITSDIVKGVTKGKYTKVKINENIKIKVEDSKTNKFIDVKNLSAGTVDQIYFAVRFGMISVINNKNNGPLILDDCFVQYDDSRLINILDFLSCIKSERQIILFTCQKREKLLMDKMNINYNYIEL